MRIDVSAFGKILISRPQGREAFLAARAYVVPTDPGEPIDLDFCAVDVLTPSWADEFLRGLEQERGPENIRVLPGGNMSVQLALKAVKNVSSTRAETQD